MDTLKNKVIEAEKILKSLNLNNEQATSARSAMVLLALLDMKPNESWKDLGNRTDYPMLRITDIIVWLKENKLKFYQENSREDIRKRSIYHFVNAALVIKNPDDPKRAVNSGQTKYLISPEIIELCKHFKTPTWEKALSDYLRKAPGLYKKYQRERERHQVEFNFNGIVGRLSPGKHSELIADVITKFEPQFISGSNLLYVGDTGSKHQYTDDRYLNRLGIFCDAHSKMPDVIFYHPQKQWLVLVEAVTSVGPINAQRYEELTDLFRRDSFGIVYVTAFQDQKTASKFMSQIAWETEIWVSEHPDHMIHKNGNRFLGPHT